MLPTAATPAGLKGRRWPGGSASSSGGGKAGRQKSFHHLDRLLLAACLLASLALLYRCVGFTPGGSSSATVISATTTTTTTVEGSTQLGLSVTVQDGSPRGRHASLRKAAAQGRRGGAAASSGTLHAAEIKQADEPAASDLPSDFDAQV